MQEGPHHPPGLSTHQGPLGLGWGAVTPCPLGTGPRQ